MSNWVVLTRLKDLPYVGIPIMSFSLGAPCLTHSRAEKSWKIMRICNRTLLVRETVKRDMLYVTS